ncbi:MAG: S8 family serine peptidase [Chitinophagales bacterium]|nr:S8 family serine peptidase [Chitinophagales bacterium]
MKSIFHSVLLLFCLGFQLNAQVNPLDSTKLINFYNQLNPEAQQYLQWDTTDSVSEWPGVTLEDIIDVGNRVVALDLSDSGIEGVLPSLADTLTFLDTLICSNNAIDFIAGLPSGLSVLDLSNNFLEDLPTSLFALTSLALENNRLTFEDLDNIILGGEIDILQFTYSPQGPLGQGSNYTYPDGSVELNVYDVEFPSPFNLYEWTKDTFLVNMGDKNYVIASPEFMDGGRYILSVTNGNFPDLTLEGYVDLYVVQPQNMPDTSTLMIQADPTEQGAIQSLMEQRGWEVEKECWCTDGENARLRLYRGTNINSIFTELNALVPNRRSRIDTDTTEFNFFLIHDPDTSSSSTIIDCTSDIVFPPMDIISGDKVKIGYVDSGFDPEHNQYANSIYINPSPATDGNCSPNDEMGLDFVNSTPVIVDNDGHGTHGMGITTYNLPDGVSFEVLNLKVFDSTGILFDLICAVQYAVDMEVEVINISMGYYAPEASDILYGALKRAQDAGILVVVSAGNDGWDVSELENRQQRWPGNFKYPAISDTTYATLDNLIVVGALNTSLDSIASFSNYGPYVDVLAPGTGIRSTLPNGEYGIYSGTSMATSFVSRLVGIIKAKAPEVTYQEIITCIRDNVENIEDDGRVAWGGKVNFEATLICLNIEVEGGFTQQTSRPSTVSVYPNPFSEVTNIILDNGNILFQNVSFTVTTMYGVPVYMENCNTNALQWDGTYSNGGGKVPLGLYFLNIRVGGNSPHIIPILRL